MRKFAMISVLAVASASLLAGQSSAPPQGNSVAATHSTKQNVRTVKKSKARRKVATAPAAAPLPAQQVPPVPATLMNSPTVKPSVTLLDGQLTIDAPNSSLSDVLSSIRRVTGATLEGPTPGERIAIKLGPGSPEQVLNALLQGTAYDYVIVGTPGAPQQITHILLAAHIEGGGGEAGDSEPAHDDQPAGANAGGVPHRHGMPMISPRQPPSEDANAEEDEPAQPAPQPEVQPQPDAQQQPPQNQTKTPEDLFRELQQLGQPPSQQNQQQK
jgi:hypothetical protein